MPLLERMRWPQVESAVESGAVAILPCGSTEQHGRQMPLYTDALIARTVAERADRLGAPVVVLPVLSYGLSSHHMDFPGTVTLSFDTYRTVVFEVCQCVRAHGFESLIVLNAHGGNRNALEEVIRTVQARVRLPFRDLLIVECLRTAEKLIPRLKNYATGHSDFREASVVAAVDPAALALDEAKGQPEDIFPGKTEDVVPSTIDGVAFRGLEFASVVDTKKVTAKGGWGNIQATDAALGEEIVQAIGSMVCDLAKALARAGKPHQRRGH